jgi:SAM-dependent methyltransferase
MPHADETQVAQAYDAVYAAIPRSPAFQQLWRTHSLGPDYPQGFEHISFLTLPELSWMRDQLALEPGSMYVDLACGMGGPGLWLARETGARIVGVDLSSVALEHASRRAHDLGLDDARFEQGSFASTGLDASSADGATSVDALQYAPDKRAAIEEIARILRPGGRLVFACFEVDPERVRSVPVMGTDPVADYAPLLAGAGFDVRQYSESDGWHDRLTRTYQAVVDARDQLTAEMGEAATLSLIVETQITLQVEPYTRRVLVAAVRR